MFDTKHRRRGGVTVEFAVIAAPLFLVLLSSIEICRALMATQTVEEAARSACRVAILRGTTPAEIDAEADRILAPAGIAKYAVATDPASVASIDRWSPVTVKVSAAYSDMSWVPLPRFFRGRTYDASCTLPKEYSTGT